MKKCTIKKYAVSLLGVGLCFGCFAEPSCAVISSGNEYLDLDISQLMQITITSVSKKEQALSDAAAAVFVITQNDIHRSGVTSIPEALRMVPGLQVARIGAEKWAISSRGFNGQTANKLLVLMDGRTLYSPSFSGVYWDVQETLLEDIDRIEVIRGPGGTLWGANAVNGIVNIITKKASETQGGLVRLSGGDKDRITGGLRYGTAISESVHARAWLTYRNHDSFQRHDSSENANDDWQSLHGGFRVDGETPQKDSWTLQGDIYGEDANQLVSPSFTMAPPYKSEHPDNYDASGWNVLARWKHQISSENSWTIQSYYDFTNRDELYIDQTHKTFDVEFQHQMKLGASHDLIWGLGYRNIRDSFDSSFQLLFSPESKTRDLFNVFVQDEIVLMADRLWLTLGSKLEHNDFTGYEIQPSGRLLFKPVENQTVWGAVSRAVRTPSRIEKDARLTAGMVPDLPPYPAPLFLWGNEEYGSEDVLAYELGYRILPTKQLSIDIAVFYNEYEDLRTSTPLVMPPTSRIQFENKSSGSSLGVELAVDWKPVQWISFQLGYTWLELNLDASDNETGLDIIVVYEESSPQHGVSLRSSIDLTHDLQMNLWLRYVDQFTAGGIQALLNNSIIDEYVAFDASISWRPTETVELMLVGQNLFTSARMEFISEYLAPLTDIEQSIYGKLTYRF
jgi:iron complex outermembrane receptor protein